MYFQGLESRRHFSASDLDLTWGSDGIVTGGSELYRPVPVVLPLADGRVMALHSADPQEDVVDFAARYLSNGAPDRAFGTNGRRDESGYHLMLVQPDLKYLLIEGQAVRRQLANGADDPSFGMGGLAFGPFEVQDAALQTDGKIVLVGSTFFDHDTSQHWIVGRINANGSLDTTFGSGKGYVTTSGFWPKFSEFDDTVETDLAARVTVQPDGKILVGGTSEYPGSEYLDWSYADALARYNSNGSVDPTFGDGGLAKFDLGTRSSDIDSRLVPWMQDLALQRDGKILATAFQYDDRAGDYVTKLIRLPATVNWDGSLDTTFASGAGMRLLPGSTAGGNPGCGQIAVQADGKIVVASSGATRYFPDGTPDPSFGLNGHWALAGGFPTSLAIQNDGHILVGTDSDEIYRLKGDSANPVSIAGSVYNDANGNGVKDSTEAGVNGWTVYVDSNNNGGRDASEAVTKTDSAGKYKFANLAPGTYKVREIPASGWHQIAPTKNYGLNVTLLPGQTATGKNFLARPNVVGAARISGSVFHDYSRDGIRQSTDNGLDNWLVWIDLDNDKVLDSNERRILTDASGNYSFIGLAAGTYKVRVMLQSGWVQTTPANGYGQTVSLFSGQQISNRSFGVDN